MTGSNYHLQTGWRVRLTWKLIKKLISALKCNPCASRGGQSPCPAGARPAAGRALPPRARRSREGPRPGRPSGGGSPAAPPRLPAPQVSRDRPSLPASAQVSAGGHPAAPGIPPLPASRHPAPGATAASRPQVPRPPRERHGWGGTGWEGGGHGQSAWCEGSAARVHSPSDTAVWTSG